MGGGPVAQPVGVGGCQAYGDAGAGVGLQGGAAAVGGQFEDVGGAGEGVGPVVAGPPAARGPLGVGGAVVVGGAAVPDDVVGELQGFGVRVEAALGVGLQQVAQDDLQGEPVAHGVVDGQQQHVVVVGQAGEEAAQQGRLGEVPGAAGLLAEQPVEFAAPALVVCGGVGQVDQGQAGGDAGHDDLGEPAVDLAQCGAQCFVAFHDAVEGGLQGGVFQGAFEVQPQGQCVGPARRGVHPVQEPQPLLARGGGKEVRVWRYPVFHWGSKASQPNRGGRAVSGGRRRRPGRGRGSGVPRLRPAAV